MKSYAYGKLVIYGTIETVQDWSMGISFTAPSAQTSDELAITCNDLSVSADALWTGPAGTVGMDEMNAPDTQMLGLRAYWYPAGSSSASAQGEYVFPAPRVGTGSASLPTQTSLVASTLTGRPGRSYRGRMYMPMTGAPLNGHLVASASVDQLAANVATYIEGVNAETTSGGNLRCVIASAIGAIPITAVRVDNRPDIQRRRADKVYANHYGNHAITP